MELAPPTTTPGRTNNGFSCTKLISLEALLRRFETLEKDSAALEIRREKLIESSITLVAGNEIQFIDALPEIMWDLWTKMSRRQRLAMTVRIREQERANGPFRGLAVTLLKGMEGEDSANNSQSCHTAGQGEAEA